MIGNFVNIVLPVAGLLGFSTSSFVSRLVSFSYYTVSDSKPTQQTKKSHQINQYTDIFDAILILCVGFPFDINVNSSITP
jgi:elongation factor P hydroxylase